jgi:hypothetical protein
MSKDVYKTAQGKSVDMGALRLQNENVRAVGNMKVNARGDQVNDDNIIISKKTDEVTRQYQRQVSNKGQ